MRKSGMFGLKNKYSSQFLGQTMLGSLACSTSAFGQREEWQADDKWEKSRLWIASAGWGNGGYLKARQHDGVLQIVDKIQADLCACEKCMVTRETRECLFNTQRQAAAMQLFSKQ